ncbi:hypothetical protein D9757_000821 [Collybiopsis confluens]|uniref:Protein SMG7 n=1 Tax=Collybiopsis confluens TaxID=2823264 RepID=A0A8H5I0F3_9AGAR|nr:hypothetical protein D9757_000821 [Collybiopsis confluens]
MYLEFKKYNRDARVIYATIKESLKTKEPFDKEIDFSRKSLRRQHLNLLLVHPYAKESENAETRLWMETSYAIIAAYKQALTRLDRLSKHTNEQPRHGLVEHRKLLQRFRQFLAEEEKFWAQFVVRYYRSFALEEAYPVLVTLGILSETEDHTEELQRHNGRNHFQFPPSTSFTPTSPADRESRLTIMSKALVCLGDIARYREQYNDSGGRSRVGPDDGGRKRHKRGGAPIADLPRPRNYEKARLCYQQAKALTPHDGNPSHQLAIIASYEKDSFTSLVHYYRSLSVDHPYETASDNMDSLLRRVLEHWKAHDPNGVPPDIAHVPKVQIEEFKKKVVLLHAFWRLGDSRKDAFVREEARNIANRFFYLVSERHLSEDFILQLVTLAQAALWKIRMHQDEDPSDNPKLPSNSSASLLPSEVVEARIYTHFLSLYSVLLEVGIDKLKEPPPIDSDRDLAQRLIVEFRRTLPAMRIAGKWLRVNYQYVMSDPESHSTTRKKRTDGADSGAISLKSVETIAFWGKYAEFLRALSRAFPADRLPDLTFTLSEDAEMRGFKPLKGYMDLKKSLKADSSENVPRKESEVHPNEVQLMRINDILGDAKALVQMEASVDFVLRGVESQVQPIPSMSSSKAIPVVSRKISEVEDDTESTSNTDDAVLREAFEHLDQTVDEGEYDDDDVDEIVWDPTPSSPPEASPILSAFVANMHVNDRASPVVAPVTPIAPIAPIAPPEKLPASPLHSRPVVRAVPSPPNRDKTTAEDLLKGFMTTPNRISEPAKARTPSETSIPRPLLFDRPGTNIWSASQDEHGLRYSSGGPQSTSLAVPQTRQHGLSVSRDSSSQQSVWPYPNAQHHPVGFVPSTSFASDPAFLVSSNASHQRLPSASVNAHFLTSDFPQHYGLSQVGFTPSHLDQLGQPLTSYRHMQPPLLENAPGGLYDPVSGPQNLRPHTRHLSLHKPQTPAIPPMSSIWGNSG